MVQAQEPFHLASLIKELKYGVFDRPGILPARFDFTGGGWNKIISWVGQCKPLDKGRYNTRTIVDRYMGVRETKNFTRNGILKVFS